MARCCVIIANAPSLGTKAPTRALAASMLPPAESLRAYARRDRQTDGPQTVRLCFLKLTPCSDSESSLHSVTYAGWQVTLCVIIITACEFP